MNLMYMTMNWAHELIHLHYNYSHIGGARGVMVIVEKNGHDDSSSNPGRELLHFT